MTVTEKQYTIILRKNYFKGGEMYVLVDESRINKIDKIQNEILNLLNNNINSTSKRNKDLDLLTVKEASKYLNISEIFLRKMIEKKEIKVIRIGRAIRIEKTELDKLVK